MVRGAAGADHHRMTDERPDEQPTETTPPTEPTQEAVPPPARGGRFLRSRDERVVGGVAGGLAKVLGIEVWVVRLGFVLTAFFGGAGVIAYLVALAFVPEDRGDGVAAEMPPLTGRRLAQGLGLAVLGIAALAILDGGLGLGWFLGPNLLVLALLAALAYAAYRGLERGGDERQPTATRIAGAVLLTGAVLSMAGVGAVAAFWLAATGGGTAAAVTVIALGAVAVVAAFFRPVRWLAPAALVVALPVGLVAAADIDLDGGIGDRTYRPLAVQDLPADGFELGVGELEVDLRELEWPRTGLVEIDVEVGVGHALVLVPRGVCVRAAGDIGVGAISVLDEESGGVDVEQELGSGRPGDAPRLVVHGTLGIGHLEVDTERGREFRGPFEGREGDGDAPVLIAPGARERGTCERA